MAITRPTTKTIISTTQWGIPITDAVNANTTDVATIKAATTATTTPWTNCTLVNGWVNLGAPRSPSAYRKLNGFVIVRISVQNGTANQVVTNLPTGIRPDYYIDYTGRAGPTIVPVNISTGGDIIVYGSDVTLVTCHIVYPVPGL